MEESATRHTHVASGPGTLCGAEFADEFKSELEGWRRLSAVSDLAAVTCPDCRGIVIARCTRPTPTVGDLVFVPGMHVSGRIIATYTPPGNVGGPQCKIRLAAPRRGVSRQPLSRVRIA